MKERKIWIWIALSIMIICTILFGYRIYISATSFNGRLYKVLQKTFNEKSIEISHKDIYKDGILGILNDISKEVDLPEKLYITSNLSVKFNHEGEIEYFSTFLYGKDSKGKDKTYLIDYDISKDFKAKIYLNGFNNCTYDEDKSLQPLIETLGAIDIEEITNSLNEDNYGILYYGKRDFAYNTDGIIYVNSQGETRFASKAVSLLQGYFVSIYVPEKESVITPLRYKLVDNLKNIEGEDYSGKVQEDNKEDLDIGSTENKSKILSDGTVEFFMDENIGYNLRVEDAAAGNRAYSLYKTTDGGNSYSLLNTSPFGQRIGSAYGINFITEEVGFIGLAHNGGANGELYGTYDGGKTFNLVKVPEHIVNLSDGTSYNPFDYIEMPYKSGDDIFMEASQGADGDYKGGINALYQSIDGGRTFIFLKEME